MLVTPPVVHSKLFAFEKVTPEGDILFIVKATKFAVDEASVALFEKTPVPEIV